MTRAWYTTRERVMHATDTSVSAYLASEIDRAIDSASDAVDSLCQRGDDIRPGFAPWSGTITFDWPVQNNNDPYRFWLNHHMLLSVESAVSGGVDITSALLPWPEYGPPFTALDVDQGSDHLFEFLTGRGQRSLSITGVWGYSDAEKTLVSWTLEADVSAVATLAGLDAPVGVGSIVRIDDERMLVTERTWADSGQTGSLTASMAAQTLAVASGAAFLPGEELLLDAERVLVRDVAGNNVIVQRAVEGSTLAVHTTAAIYRARSCTVERGALGTVAASHTAGAQLHLFDPPKLIEQLTIAYAIDERAQESAAYARTVGSGNNARMIGGDAIEALEKRVMSAHGRQFRHRAVGA